jgi:hypothetical protein
MKTEAVFLSEISIDSHHTMDVMPSQDSILLQIIVIKAPNLKSVSRLQALRV